MSSPALSTPIILSSYNSGIIMSQSKKFMSARGYEVKDVFNVETGQKIRYGKGSRKDLMKLERKLRKQEAKEAHELRSNAPDSGSYDDNNLKPKTKKGFNGRTGEKRAAIFEKSSKDLNVDRDETTDNSKPISPVKPKAPASCSSPSNINKNPQIISLETAEKKNIVKKVELGPKEEPLKVSVFSVVEPKSFEESLPQTTPLRVPNDPRAFLETFAKVGMTEEFQRIFEREEADLDTTLKTHLESEIAMLQAILSR